jgi:endonuclease-3
VPEEPSENIASGRPAAFEAGSADTRAERVVDALGERYWQATYGDADGFECLVRTVLSQNTSDTASQPAHDALMDRYGGDDLAAALAAADRAELRETIAPAGLYRRKSEVIVDCAATVHDEWGSTDAFDRWVRDADPAAVRDRLLAMHGVGPKTADCVLLFAGGRDGVFPVDTHVHRVARRMGLAPPDADHEGVRAALEADVPPEKCGFGHTATIQFGREFCTARRPACLDGPEACPLSDPCDRVGVDEATGEVVDPRDAG